MQVLIHLVRREPNPGATAAAQPAPGLRFNNGPLTYNNLVANNILPEIVAKMNYERYLQKSSGAVSTTKERAESKLDARLSAYIPTTDQAAFKTALYTIGLLVLAALLSAGGWCVYRLLTPFVKPMLWAVLTGTVLFPLKQALTSAAKGWLRSLRTTSTPLLVGFATLPVSWLNVCADGIWHVLSTHLLFYLLGAFGLIKLMIYERLFLSVIDVAGRLHGRADAFVQLIASPIVGHMPIRCFQHAVDVVPFTLVYCCVYVGWLYVQQERPNKKLARVLSLPVWLVLIVNVSDLAGPLRVLCFAGVSLTIALLAAGALAYESALAPSDAAAETAVAVTGDQESSLGWIYLQVVFSCCALLFVARHTWVLALLSVPLLFALLKQIYIKCDVGNKLSALMSGGGWEEDKQQQPTGWAQQAARIYDITVPHTLRDFVKFILYKDQNIVGWLESSMDLLSSVLVIVLLCVAMLFAAFFVVFQMHSEALHLARLGSDVVNEMKNGTWSAAVQFTDEQLAETDVDAYVQQAFTQGRGWMAEQVRQLADPGQPERAAELETQVMTIVDNLYELWQQRQQQTADDDGDDEDSPLSSMQHEDVWAHLSKATDLTALKEQLTLIVKENVDTILAVAQSVWGVLASNMGFVSQVFASLAGVILSFGMELLNALIQLVVYFTMLYYLLVYSTDQFLPIALLSRLSINNNSEDSGGSEVSSPEHSVSAAIEQSINGVFLLSAKMSVFYGLYTWFIHNLFGLSIVFLPSVLALLLAAVPLTAPSWVCFIGMAELLVRGEQSAAVLFFAASAAPMAFADGVFYQEVKGTHPYVTGLAVVGGMYWLGLQGAIIGPILLCCVLALVHVTSNMLA